MDPFKYSLYLFDFDGLLVNTEEVHFQAYKTMLAARGFALNWDMPTYASYALFSSEALKEAILKTFPALKAPWPELYNEKKAAYLSLIQEGSIALMPGVEAFITRLHALGKKMVVVTHSPLEQVALLQKKLPLLQRIEHWVTREDYTQPKPSPDAYQTALARFADANDNAVGFEDSPRGLQALLGAQVEAVLVSSVLDKEAVEALKAQHERSFSHVDSFRAFS